MNDVVLDRLDGTCIRMSTGLYGQKLPLRGALPLTNVASLVLAWTVSRSANIICHLPGGHPHHDVVFADDAREEVLEATAVAAPGGDVDYEAGQSMDEDDAPTTVDGVPEEPLLLLMEWSGLPRRMAIDLLAAHGNDPNAVLAEIYN